MQEVVSQKWFFFCKETNKENLKLVIHYRSMPRNVKHLSEMAWRGRFDIPPDPVFITPFGLPRNKRGVGRYVCAWEERMSNRGPFTDWTVPPENPSLTGNPIP
ncbi:hypothetical protein AVEN_91670-1 [Araneus ventricosus]|uniref:Uncharacterized protein n=1 Tax=Araneus ventricosus TaxID=182803 RepID=A0A4Y2IUG7_ARAVE|nr:hypothetical protein AVEN_91670-1 [Araneus ventricosus]